MNLFKKLTQMLNKSNVDDAYARFLEIEYGIERRPSKSALDYYPQSLLGNKAFKI